MKKAPKQSENAKNVKTLAELTGDKNWVYNSKTRGYDNPTFTGDLPGMRKTDTGASISRRQFDVRYGLLKIQGFTGYEDKRDTRKKQALHGFKVGKTFKNFAIKSFKSREDMIETLLYLPPAENTFRVILGGVANNQDKYKPGDNNISYAFAEQMDYMKPHALAKAYIANPDEFEANFAEVVEWKLVAKKIGKSKTSK